jgi:hypothetical protein
LGDALKYGSPPLPCFAFWHHVHANYATGSVIPKYCRGIGSVESGEVGVRTGCCDHVLERVLETERVYDCEIEIACPFHEWLLTAHRPTNLTRSGQCDCIQWYAKLSADYIAAPKKQIIVKR